MLTFGRKQPHLGDRCLISAHGSLFVPGSTCMACELMRMYGEAMD